MKKIIAITGAVLICASFSFACTYNEENHTLTECTEYVRGEGDIPEECQKAHSAYNKYIAEKVGKKAKKTATKVGNSIVKFVGNVVEKDNENSEVEE